MLQPPVDASHLVVYHFSNHAREWNHAVKSFQHPFTVSFVICAQAQFFQRISIQSRQMYEYADTVEMCVQVSELQGNVQELQEALDQEASASREAQAILEEAFHHRKALEAT